MGLRSGEGQNIRRAVIPVSFIIANGSGPCPIGAQAGIEIGG
jgi:hypothetical protein